MFGLANPRPARRAAQGQGLAVSTADSNPPEYREVAVEDRDIIELHKEGVPAIEIAALLDVAPELVRYRLRRAGFEPVLVPKFLKAEERRSDIIRLHQEGLPAKGNCQKAWPRREPCLPASALGKASASSKQKLLSNIHRRRLSF